MARIEVEITGKATGLTGSLKAAAKAISDFEKASERSASGAQQALGKTEASVAKVDRTFKLLSKAPFSFGVNGAKAADKVTAALVQTERQAESLNRTFSLIKNPSFSFGVGALGGLKQSADAAAPSVNKLSREISGANTVGIEFSRIIQDAPFGIIGVGNNITQLTQSFANLRAQTGSTSQALGIAFRSMFSGANLLVLGVSAVTTAFTFYNMWARSNKKETEELDDAVRTYIDSLSDLERAELDAQKANDKALTTLDSLWAIYKDVNSSQQERLSAMRQIISENPAYFKGLKDEELLTNKAAEAYGNLRNSLILAATARAYSSRLESATSQFLDEDEYIRGLEKRAEAVARRISETTMRTLGLIASGEVTGQAITSIPADELRAHDELLKIQDEIRSRSVERFKYSQQQIQLENKITDITRQRLQYFDLESEAKNETTKATRDQVNLEDTLSKLRQESIQAGLSGYEKELQASQHKYDELKRQADTYYREGKISAREYADYVARLQGFRVGELGRITGGASAAPLGQGRPSTTGVVPVQLPGQAASVDASMRQSWNDFVDDLDKQLDRSVQSFGRDFLRTLSTINQQTDITISGLVNSLVSSLTGGITEILSTVFTKQLSESVRNGFATGGGLGKAGTYGAAGAALLGSIISGATKRTSIGGQALGGALAGAGSGAAIGAAMGSAVPVVGTIIGAVVGALGGILGASSARKRERAQEEMVKQQERTNRLLEYQNALSYASDIRGQMTAGGVVTGIMRDAFGQLVATVRGDELAFVLQRSGGNR